MNFFQFIIKNLFVVTLLTTGLVFAQSPAEQKWQVNFKDSDIQEVIKFVADVTGKTVVIDPRVKGRVKVISAEPLAQQALYDLFLSVLEIQGFTAIEVGDTVRILPRKDARTSPVPVQPQNSQGDDAYITEVIQLSNADAAKVLPVLRPLAPQHAHLAAYAPDGTLIGETIGGLALLTQVQVTKAVDETRLPPDQIALRTSPLGPVIGIRLLLDSEHC